MQKLKSLLNKILGNEHSSSSYAYPFLFFIIFIELLNQIIITNMVIRMATGCLLLPILMIQTHGHVPRFGTLLASTEYMPRRFR